MQALSADEDREATRRALGAAGSTAPRVDDKLPVAAAIGAQIRLLRKRLEITGAELASRAGLSAGMLSKIENGAVSPSLESLEAVATALNVPLTGLFATYEERRDCSFVPAGQGVSIDRRGTKAGHQYRLLGHSLSGDLVVEPYLITLSGEAEPYPVFQHAGIEFIYMLTGAVTDRHADLTHPLRPGDALSGARPAGRFHRQWSGFDVSSVVGGSCYERNEGCYSSDDMARFSGR